MYKTQEASVLCFSVVSYGNEVGLLYRTWWQHRKLLLKHLHRDAHGIASVYISVCKRSPDVLVRVRVVKKNQNAKSRPAQLKAGLGFFLPAWVSGGAL